MNDNGSPRVIKTTLDGSGITDTAFTPTPKLSDATVAEFGLMLNEMLLSSVNGPVKLTDASDAVLPVGPCPLLGAVRVISGVSVRFKELLAVWEPPAEAPSQFPVVELVRSTGGLEGRAKPVSVSLIDKELLPVAPAGTKIPPDKDSVAPVESPAQLLLPPRALN
jgi:hypothetical protein